MEPFRLPPDPREELSFIRSVIEDSRRAVVVDATPFLVWGGLVVVGAALEYLLPRSFDAVWSWMVLMGLGWSPYTLAFFAVMMVLLQIVPGILLQTHFLGLHGLQVLPLGASLIGRWMPKESVRIASVFILAVLYMGLGTLAFVQASRGLPLL
jgi:hypothetical protein